jgi:Ala-tRNA(Pro) deacylase
MPIQSLKRFLDDNHVKYISIAHSRAYTASEVAYSAHVPHKTLAKTVMVKVDGTLAMAVVSADHFVDVDRLKMSLGANQLELARESDFETKFPDCEIGAMPPFGNLYGMPVYISTKLTSVQEIAFNAGSHTEVIKLALADFMRLVTPTTVDF